MDELLSNLNKAQHEAVVTTEGPVMVMAGAGSGKTKVLTTRIAYLIREKNVSPYRILAVTFTNKAAREMKERVAKMVDLDTRFMWVSTFHSFCCRLLREEINALPGYDKNFTILDEEDSLKVIRDILKDMDLDVKPKEMQKLISKMKNFSDYVIKDPQEKSDYDAVSKKYEEKLHQDNLLDFDDLILRTIELFKKNPSVLEKYQNKFSYIMVDEFQDTNTMQYDLMFMLSARFHNIFVVGDDFQSIYSFRGAKIENINRFRRDFRETKLILLEENYRSTTQILNLANNVIEHNPDQIKKVMFSNSKTGAMPYVYRATSAYDEVMFVVDKIRNGIVSGKKFSDYAVMYRSNYISRNFEDAFIKAQIPYRIYGGLSFFSRMEIKDMIAYLRLTLNVADNFSFERVVNVPKRKIGPKLLGEISSEALCMGISEFESAEMHEGKGIIAENLKKFTTLVRTIGAQIDSVKLPDLVDMVLEQSGYEEELKKEEDTFEERMNNLKELKSVLAETEEFYDGSNSEKLSAFFSDLALRTDNDDEKSDENTVKLTTYHQAKGLEFDTVFMVATEEGIFPSDRSTEPKSLEEERRICYVGVTRAKRELYITYAQSRFLFGEMSFQNPSRFVSEMRKELYEDNVRQKPKITISVTPARTVAPAKTAAKPAGTASGFPFSAGDKINHKAFGDGLVVSTDPAGDAITVAFGVPYGVKRLKASHPAIRKIK